jgi:hypothetical protein
VSVYSQPLDEYRQALDSDDPLWVLRDAAVRQLEAYGGNRDRLLYDLERLRNVLQREGRNDDVVLEVMDFVTGWSSPHVRI